jgi:hypothetical protein
MVQQHLNRSSDVRRIAFVDCGQDPHGLGERQHRHPRAVFDERIGGGHLLRLGDAHDVEIVDYH